MSVFTTLEGKHEKKLQPTLVIPVFNLSEILLSCELIFVFNKGKFCVKFSFLRMSL